MSKTFKNPNTLALTYFVLTAILAMIIWPLFDLILCNLITHSDFKYDVNEYIIQPVIFAAILTLILYIMRYFHKSIAKEAEKNKSEKKSKKSKE